MGIFLPRRWRQQPQGPIDLDRANPLGARARSVWLPGRYTTTRGALVNSAVGRAAQDVTDQSWLLPRDAALQSASRFTVFVHGVLTASSGTHSKVFGTRGTNEGDGNRRGVELGIRSGTFVNGFMQVIDSTGSRDGGSEYTDSGASGSVILGTPSWWVFDVQRASVTSVDTWYYTRANGVRQISNYASTLAHGDDTPGVNAPGVAGGFAGVAAVSDFQNALTFAVLGGTTAAERALFFENPWQVFAPQRPVFYSLAQAVSLFPAIGESSSNRSTYLLANAPGATFDTDLSVDGSPDNLDIPDPGSADISLEWDAGLEGGAAIKVEIIDPRVPSTIKTAYISASGDNVGGATVTEAERTGMTWPGRLQAKFTSMLAADVPGASSALAFPTILRRKWARQSPGTLRLDSSNPLAAALVFAAVPTDSGWIDAVSGQLAQATSTTPETVDYMPLRGNGSPTLRMRRGSATGHFRWNNQTGLDRLAQSNWSVFAEAGPASNADSPLIFRSSEPNNGFGLGMGFDDILAANNSLLPWCNNGSVLAPVDNNILGADYELAAHRFGVTSDGSVTRYYTLGKLSSTVTGVATPTADSGRRTRLYGTHNSPDNTGSPNTRIGMVLVWSRPISLYEYRMLYENPWQIFMPRKWPW